MNADQRRSNTNSETNSGTDTFLSRRKKVSVPEFAQRSAEELAADAAAGSSACFEELVGRLSPRLLRYLRRRVGDEHAAEDVLQETFLKAYRNLGRYDPSRSFATWMFTIATRLAADHWRSFRPAASIERMDPADGGQPDPLEAVARREQAEGLWARASRVLPAAQFTALWLRYAEEMAVRDIAGVLGKSVVGVKVTLHRACRRMLKYSVAPAHAPAGAPGRGVEGAVKTQ
ncbi:MAG TPA: sigma-70 family RNA polymerase sigma factor [Phycisphaerae bacterium]|nr:sigma-70 family RNA polymerase sigma factor [Phycisphaerae bacterium]